MRPRSTKPIRELTPRIEPNDLIPLGLDTSRPVEIIYQGVALTVIPVPAPNNSTRWRFRCAGCQRKVKFLYHNKVRSELRCQACTGTRDLLAALTLSKRERWKAAKRKLLTTSVEE